MATKTQKTNPPDTIFLMISGENYYTYATVEDLMNDFNPDEDRVFQYSTPVEGTFSSPVFIPKKT